VDLFRIAPEQLQLVGISVPQEEEEQEEDDDIPDLQNTALAQLQRRRASWVIGNLSTS
jgi:hypothetical protein